MNKKIYLVLSLVILSTILITGSVLAINTKTTATEPAIMQNGQGMQGSDVPKADVSTQTRTGQAQQGVQMQIQKSSGISGKIASISGTTITLEAEDSYTITINASSATVKKLISTTSTSSATSTAVSVSDLKVGDFITVKGNITVSASEIIAGTQSSEKPSNPGAETSDTKRIVGTVTAIDNTTITINSAQKNSTDGGETTTYTVNASGATVTQKTKEGTDEILAISDIKVGNTIFVQGEASDSTITATAISITASGENQTNGKANNGIWNKITNFFGKMFGK
jgi:ribosome maturation factor RimP